MKKVAIILFILLALMGISAVAFIASFDVNRYRPLIKEKLETALGKPVEIGSMSLGWEGGIALEMHNLILYSDQAGRDVWLRLPSASGLVRLSPLMHRKIEVASLVLKRAEIQIVRGPDGSFRAFEKGRPVSVPEPGVPGAPPSGIPAEKPQPSRPPAAAAVLPFLMDQVKIENTEIIYRDEFQQPAPVNLQVHDADLTLQNVSLDEPVQFRLRAGVLSHDQNLLIDGKLRYDVSSRVVFMENVHAETDFDKLRIVQLYDAFPGLRGSGLKEMRGQLDMNVQSLRLDPQGLQNFSAQLRLNGGRFAFDNSRSAFENVSLDVVAAQDQIQIRSVNADYAGGKITGSGTVTNYNAIPLTSLQATLSDIVLTQLLPEPRPGEPSLEGTLSATFQGTAQGKSASFIKQTLAGQGQITIPDAIVRNFNALREVLSKLSMVPGLLPSLDKSLPESYREKLNRTDTPLAPLDLPFTAQNGVFNIPRLQAATDAFRITGPAVLTANGDFRAQTLLEVEPELTKAFIASQPQLQYLTNQAGNIELPLNLQSFPPYVLPDLQFIATRLASSKTQEWLSDLVRKREGNAAAQPSQGSAGTTDTNTAVPQTEPSSSQPAPVRKLPKAKDLLGELLQSALQPQESTSGQAETETDRRFR